MDFTKSTVHSIENSHVCKHRHYLSTRLHGVTTHVTIIFIVTTMRALNHRYFCVSGVHKYVLDDRLFARPLYSDHLNNSRCMECHLPYNLSKSKMRETPPVTLPSTLQDPEIQVSIPLGSPRGRRPSASGNVLSHKKMTQPSGKSRSASNPRSRSQPNTFMRTLGDLKPRAPPPADTLALRYQKGVAKWSVCNCCYSCSVQCRRLVLLIKTVVPKDMREIFSGVFR